MMWKRFLVIVGGAALAVSLPMAAIAVTPGTGGMAAVDPMTADDVPLAEQYQYRDTVVDVVQTQDQEMVRQRLRVHIETGPPEGFEPIQERLHRSDQMGIGNGEKPMGDPNAPRGNPDAPRLGDGTGDCIQDGEPMGTGPHGPGGRNNS